MGSKLSIVNDTEQNVLVEVKTVGGLYTVGTQIYTPAARGHFNLAKVWHDLHFTFQDGGTRQTTIYMGSDKTIRCSAIPNFVPPDASVIVKAGDKVKHILSGHDLETYKNQYNGYGDDTISQAIMKAETLSKRTIGEARISGDYKAQR